MSEDQSAAIAQEIEWENGELPSDVAMLFYVCRECGHRVALSPRNGKAPSLYCGECECGDPLCRYAIEFADGLLAKRLIDGIPEVPDWYEP